MNCVKLEKEFMDMIEDDPSRDQLYNSHLYNIDLLKGRRRFGVGTDTPREKPLQNFGLDPEWLYGDIPTTRDDYEEGFRYMTATDDNPISKKHGDVIECYLKQRATKIIHKSVGEWSARPGNPGYRMALKRFGNGRTRKSKSKRSRRRTSRLN
jgi:hypothetical protein